MEVVNMAECFTTMAVEEIRELIGRVHKLIFETGYTDAKMDNVYLTKQREIVIIDTEPRGLLGDFIRLRQTVVLIREALDQFSYSLDSEVLKLNERGKNNFNYILEIKHEEKKKALTELDRRFGRLKKHQPELVA